ncbi:MAG: glycosyltransferase [Betaproteobacteria bacterium]|nr:glycosyltransferase [Betaproteobacteria bacterium]
MNTATSDQKYPVADSLAIESSQADFRLSVTVAICTFRRPEGLQRALDGLWKQVGIASAEVAVLVVDNDASGSARAVVDQNSVPRGWVLRYVIEPHPGVSHARNRCLAESRTELIAFFDDDEVPEPDWLAALLETQRVTGADAVFGPVISRFESRPPSWMAGCTAHKRPRHPTGSVVDWKKSRTGNVLLGPRLIALAGGGFDVRFATSGGEDALFFARAERAGAHLVWCDEAVVVEDVPATRMRLSWVLERSFKGGQTWVRIRAEFSRGIWLPMALRGAASVVVAGIALLPALLVSRGAAVRQAQRVAGGLGKMTAWWAAGSGRGVRSGHYVG